jgi:hypothetical protein
LTPRDWQITLGDKLLRVLPMQELDSLCTEYAQAGGIVIDPHGGTWDENCILNQASASCIVRVGRDVFFDNSDFLRPDQTRWIVDNVLGPEYRIHEAVTDGHGDAVFAILKPGAIISTMHDADINYRDAFPGWEVCRVNEATITATMELGKFRYESFNGRWYVQGQETTPEFASFVDTYLTKWTGSVQETVFDVNMLIIDPKNVIVFSYNKQVFDALERFGITPHVVPFRHRYFWDGGIHCVTSDLHRAGVMQDYFPERG